MKTWKKAVALLLAAAMVLSDNSFISLASEIMPETTVESTVDADTEETETAQQKTEREERQQTEAAQEELMSQEEAEEESKTAEETEGMTDGDISLISESQKQEAEETTGEDIIWEEETSETPKAETSGDFTYTVSGSNATITAYSGTGGEITIPSQIGDYTVTAIGNSAFDGKSEITGIVIPETVTTLGYYAFRGTGIQSITIPKSVTTCSRANINGPFAGATELEEVIFEEGITAIPSYA
ncbi:MAG: leucine-rich repeat protein, partial [Lachnospiraceae bacterium]